MFYPWTCGGLKDHLLAYAIILEVVAKQQIKPKFSDLAYEFVWEIENFKPKQGSRRYSVLYVPFGYSTICSFDKIISFPGRTTHLCKPFEFPMLLWSISLRNRHAYRDRE